MKFSCFWTVYSPNYAGPMPSGYLQNNWKLTFRPVGRTAVLSAPYQFAIRATKVGDRKFAARAVGSLRGAKGYRPLHPLRHQLGKLGRAKPLEIGFVQCFLGHRGHSGAIPKNRTRELLGMTECTRLSRGVDFVEYFLCDSSNVDMALT